MINFTSYFKIVQKNIIMSEAQNLHGQDAIDKLKKIVTDTKVCMFCTNLEEQPVATRPMLVQGVDDNGDIWFLSSDVSDKNIDVKIDDKVQLLFANLRGNEYLTIYGSAYVYNDKKIIEMKSAHSVKAWIPQGNDDPNISLIRIIPGASYYWDSKRGELKF